MTWTNRVIPACTATALLFSGCASNTIVMKPPVKEVSIPAANSVVYKLNDVKISSYALQGDWGKQSASGRFARLAEERYPALFSDSPSAIPLDVKIQINQETHDGAALVTFMCTLGILGGLFPSLPWTNEWQIKAEIDDGRTAGSTELQAVHRGWWSLFSPFGLMPISGESDIPVVSTVGVGGPGAVPPDLCDYVMGRVVDSLAAKLLNPSPSQPVSQPLLIPVSIPSPSTLPLVLPAQTVSPF